MERGGKQIIYFFLVFVLTAMIQLKAYGCEGQSLGWMAKSDALGRQITVWANALQVIQISIDNSTPVTLSPEGQRCVSPTFDVTPTGDIVVLWAALTEIKSLLLYGTMLPFGGTWTAATNLCEEGDIVVENAYKVDAISSNKINVFWENTEYFISQVTDPGALMVKQVLHTIPATIQNGWQLPGTAIVTLYQSGE